MSQKKREGQRTARQRLQEQRERDRVRDRRRRAAAVGGGIAAVLAVVAAVGIVVKDTSGESAGGPAAAPSGTVGGAGLAVPVGATDAPSTLTVYEDFRCPACDGFEKTFRSTVHSLTDSGKLRVEYHLVRLIDGNLGGSGSLRSANAAACAQAAGRFRPYHDVLYDNQPEETDDALADNGRLLELAGRVPGLRTGSFTSCVRNGRYDGWVARSQAAFAKAGFDSTPTVLLNGRSVYGDRRSPLTPAALRGMVEKADRGPRTPAPAPSAG